jgi:hypothetical protein
MKRQKYPIATYIKITVNFTKLKSLDFTGQDSKVKHFLSIL